ncbi:unnamed protein product [Caretta caretta]
MQTSFSLHFTPLSNSSPAVMIVIPLFGIGGGRMTTVCSVSQREMIFDPTYRFFFQAFAREVNADAGKLLSMRNPVTVIKHKRHGFLSLSARGTPTRQQAIILNEPFKKDNRTLKILISHLPEEFPPMLH